ncbi:MAG TPA: hypothetical protein VFA07_15380 [Chthonomonadaceae bacterium]|nr:hypothetical protein [Chthonomonadaceae bacterium]
MAHFLLAYVVCVAVIYSAWNWVLIPYLDRRPPPAGKPWPVGQLPSAFALTGVRLEDRPVDLLIVCAKHGGEDKKGYIRLFRCDTRQLLVEFPVPGLGNNMLATSRNGRYLGVTIAYGESNVRLYSLAELLKLRKGQQPHYRAIAVDKQPTSLAFSPDGRTLAIGTIEGTISVYNLESQRGDTSAEYVRLWHDQEITALAFSPKDPALLVSASAEGVTLWRSPDAWSHSKNAGQSETNVTGQMLWRPSAPVTALAFNEDGILAAAWQSTIRLMGPASTEDILDLSHPGVQALAFQGPLLASAGKEGKLWDLRPEEAGKSSALTLKKTPQALSIYQGGARFVAWTKHYSALLQIGLDDMAQERPLSALTQEPVPQATFEPVSTVESWSPVTTPIPSLAPAAPALPVPQGATKASQAAPRPARERRPMSPLQKLGVPVALCSALLPSFGVYLLNHLLPPAAENPPAAAKIDFPGLSSLVQDTRNMVQKAQSSEKTGHKALAKTQWTQVQALMSTVNADDHPDWFQKARQEQQAIAAMPSPQPGPQNEALNDIAESQLDLAKADAHLNSLVSARKAMAEIERSYSQAFITEPDGKALPAPQAVQKDLPALAKKAAAESSANPASRRHRPLTRSRKTSPTKRTS